MDISDTDIWEKVMVPTPMEGSVEFLLLLRDRWDADGLLSAKMSSVCGGCRLSST